MTQTVLILNILVSFFVEGAVATSVSIPDPVARRTTYGTVVVVPDANVLPDELTYLLNRLAAIGPLVANLPRLDQTRLRVCARDCDDLFSPTRNEVYINLHVRDFTGGYHDLVYSEAIWIHELGHAMFENYLLTTLPTFRYWADQTHRYLEVRDQYLDAINLLWKIENSTEAKVQEILLNKDANPRGLTKPLLSDQLTVKVQTLDAESRRFKPDAQAYAKFQKMLGPYTEFAADLLSVLFYSDAKAILRSFLPPGEIRPDDRNSLGIDLRARDFSESLSPQGWLAGETHPDPHVVLGPLRSASGKLIFNGQPLSIERKRKLFEHIIDILRLDLLNRTSSGLTEESPGVINDRLIKAINE